MDRCDVLIVGGGPAGSSCAWGLRKSGLRVMVLDKRQFPRDKVCAGWITPQVLAQLEIDPDEYSKGGILQPITGFRVGCIGHAGVEIDYSKTVSYGIRRREFDDYLIRRCGAQLKLGTPLASLERSASGWIANHEIEAEFVVGAGGHCCPVARMLGARAGNEAAVVAQEVEFRMDAAQACACRVRGEMPELYFCEDMLGYGWCFRKGAYLNIGFGRADSHGLPARVQDFLAFLKSSGRVTFELPPMRGHAYLLRGASPRRVVDDDVILIGDAAGIANPVSGEGIRPAIDSGLKAAKAILCGCSDPHEQNPGASKGTWAALAARAALHSAWLTRKLILEPYFLNPVVR